MSRIRSIKPEFFLDDEIATMEPLARLLFIGLWLMADREGRLENRPKRVKAEVLPYDDCNIELMLTKLATGGFVNFYEVGGERYIEIPNFLKHQRPNIKESPSVIPQNVTGDNLEKHGCKSGKALMEGKGREGRGVKTLAYGEGFEEFWKAYPERKGKKYPASVKYAKRIKDGATDATLLLAAQNYARERATENDPKFTQHASTFLNQRGDEDYQTAPVAPADDTARFGKW